MLDSMRQKLQKRPRGVRGLQIFCIIFLLGNLLFFSTGIFMPKHYKDVEIAPIGTELELGEYTLTITSWDWAEKDRAFEIIFEVKDLSLNREPGYTFRFRCGDSHYRYKIYRDLGDLLVVRVSGVSSRFAQVAMTVKAGSASRSIYMDDRTMAHVERLEERSDAAYRIHAVEGTTPLPADAIRASTRCGSLCLPMSGATRIPAGVPSSRPKIRAGRSARENTPPRSNTGPCTTWSGKDG